MMGYAAKWRLPSVRSYRAAWVVALRDGHAVLDRFMCRAMVRRARMTFLLKWGELSCDLTANHTAATSWMAVSL